MSGRHGSAHLGALYGSGRVERRAAHVEWQIGDTIALQTALTLSDTLAVETWPDLVAIAGLDEELGR